MQTEFLSTDLTPKFKIGEVVLLTKEAKEYFGKDIKYSISSGSVRSIRKEEGVGVIITITRGKQSEEFHQDFLRKRVPWMSGFSCARHQEYNEADKARLDAAMQIKEIYKRGRSLQNARVK